MFKQIQINKLLSGFFLVFLLAVTVAPVLTLAQGTSNPNPGTSNPTSMNIKIENPFKQDSIRGLIETIVKEILVPVGAVIAVIMVMYAGFLYVTARGNPAQIQQAHQALLWAVIGAAILLGAWVISEAISGTIKQFES